MPWSDWLVKIGPAVLAGIVAILVARKPFGTRIERLYDLAAKMPEGSKIRADYEEAAEYTAIRSLWLGRGSPLFSLLASLAGIFLGLGLGLGLVGSSPTWDWLKPQSTGFLYAAAFIGAAILVETVVSGVRYWWHVRTENQWEAQVVADAPSTSVDRPSGVDPQEGQTQVHAGVDEDLAQPDRGTT